MAELVVTIADYLDQTLAVNGWRDHHMVDPLDTPLFPGDMRPEVCLFWMAAACRAVKGFLDVVPPIFDACTATLTSRDEERARDLYWGVVQNTSSLSDADALASLDEAARLNPHIGEVDALAAQLHFRNHRFRKAKRLAASALRKLYAMGATWDKRLSYEAWVGFCRLLVVRSEAEGGLPRAPGAHNVNDLGVRPCPSTGPWSSCPDEIPLLSPLLSPRPRSVESRANADSHGAPANQYRKTHTPFFEHRND